MPNQSDSDKDKDKDTEGEKGGTKLIVGEDEGPDE
jgi:hypothetical protein